MGECCSVPADSTAGSRILSCNSFFKNTQKIQQKALVLTRLGKGHIFFTWTCKERKKKKKKEKKKKKREKSGLKRGVVSYQCRFSSGFSLEGTVAESVSL